MPLFDTHRVLLDGDLDALTTRCRSSPLPESPPPKVYGETGEADEQAAVVALLEKNYPLQQPGEQVCDANDRPLTGSNQFGRWLIDNARRACVCRNGGRKYRHYRIDRPARRHAEQPSVHLVAG